MSNISLAEVLNDLPGGSKESFLEGLLSRAGTLDDEDFNLVSKASLELSVDLGVKYLLAKGKKEEAITVFEESKEYFNAAELCAELKMYDRAVQNYESSGDIKKAVEVYLGVEYVLEQELMELEMITSLEKDGRHDEAAELCKRFGMTIRAIKNLKLGGDDEGAEKLTNVSDPAKAAQVWERNEGYMQSVNLLFRNELFTKLATTHVRAGHFINAAGTYERLMDFDSALGLYKQARFDHGVERILKEQGREEELVAYWHETKNSSSLAKHYRNKDPEKAAGFYAEIRDYKTAAQSLVEAKKPLEAMQILVNNHYYEDALCIGDTLQDAEVLDKDKLGGLKTQCYQELALRYETSDPKRALDFYSKLNDRDNVIRLANNLMDLAGANGEFKSAAEYALIIGENNKAATFRAAYALPK